MKPYPLSSVGQKYLPLIEKDPDETIVYEIRKHPFGMVGIYATGLFVAISIMAVALAVLHYSQDDSLGIGDISLVGPIAVLAGGVMALATLAVTAVTAYLYRSNVVFVTTDKVAQVLYRTLFDRQISQLSIGDVQDVTTQQRGVFARLFNYGTLVIETAGEQSNYTFNYTPRPYEASQAIVNAHEENLKQYGN